MVTELAPPGRGGEPPPPTLTTIELSSLTEMKLLHVKPPPPPDAMPPPPPPPPTQTTEIAGTLGEIEAVQEALNGALAGLKAVQAAPGALRSPPERAAVVMVPFERGKPRDRPLQCGSNPRQQQTPCADAPSTPCTVAKLTAVSVSVGGLETPDNAPPLANSERQQELRACCGTGTASSTKPGSATQPNGHARGAG